jgi:hypothetical protein
VTYVVYATREDGSTVHGIMDGELVPIIFRHIFKSGLASEIKVMQRVDGVAYADRSPNLSIDEALAWRQPDDKLTRALEAFRGYDLGTLT